MKPVLQAISQDRSPELWQVGVCASGSGAESKLLFQVISDCYKQRSVIITTNLEFSKWINVFHDEQMTAAMIDRLGHHSYLLLLDGRSYRIKDLLMREHSHNSLERCCKTSLQEQRELLARDTPTSLPVAC